jgi:hypothetical protein
MTGWTVTSRSWEGSRTMRATPRRASTNAFRSDHHIREGKESAEIGDGEVRVMVIRVLLS